MRLRVSFSVVLTVFLSALLWACGGNEPNEPETGIEGTWAWVGTYGGYAGVKILQEDYLNIYSLKFDDGNFKIYRDKEIIIYGTYTLSLVIDSVHSDTTQMMTQTTEYIKTGLDIPTIVSSGDFDVTDSSLGFFSVGCIDCYSSGFKRKSR